MEEQANQNKGNSSSKVGLAIVGIIVIAFIGIVAYQSQNKSQNQNTAGTQTPAVTQTVESKSTTTEPTASQTTESSEYKDGTYTAVGHYTSPGGKEELGVTLTIANGIVTDSKVEVKATRPTSVERQTDFATHYEPQVEGKNIDEISLTKVSGSSLSPKGFNDAVEQIKTQAQS